MRQDVKSNDLKQSKVVAPRTKRAKKFPYFIRDMRTAELFTEEEAIYTVSFTADVQKEYGGSWCELEFRDIYSEHHPLLAVGMAIADCDAKYHQVRVRLHNIRVEKR